MVAWKLDMSPPMDGRDPLPTMSSQVDGATSHAVRVFLRRVEDRYFVREIILYGSRARSTHSDESDADLAVVLRGEKGDRSAVARDWAGIAFDVLMNTGILVEPLPIWEAEFDAPQAFANPALLRTIARDGVRL